MVFDNYLNNNVLVESEGKRFIYCPSTFKDHLATEFVTIQSCDMQDNWLFLEVLLHENLTADNNCVVLVQDQNFNTILRIQTKNYTYSTKTIEKYAEISKYVESIRICIFSKENTPVILPKSISLKQITIQ